MRRIERNVCKTQRMAKDKIKGELRKI